MCGNMGCTVFQEKWEKKVHVIFEDLKKRTVWLGLWKPQKREREIRLDWKMGKEANDIFIHSFIHFLIY